MDEKLAKINSLIIAANKLLLQVLEENTQAEAEFNETDIDKMYDAFKCLLTVQRLLR